MENSSKDLGRETRTKVYHPLTVGKWYTDEKHTDSKSAFLFLNQIEERGNEGTIYRFRKILYAFGGMVDRYRANYRNGAYEIPLRAIPEGLYEVNEADVDIISNLLLRD